eukprot:5101671-Pyramimonas_sp.AAC.1
MEESGNFTSVTSGCRDLRVNERRPHKRFRPRLSVSREWNSIVSSYQVLCRTQPAETVGSERVLARLLRAQEFQVSLG